jgi:hypothetical protein
MARFENLDAGRVLTGGQTMTVAGNDRATHRPKPVNGVMRGNGRRHPGGSLASAQQQRAAQGRRDRKTR